MMTSIQFQNHSDQKLRTFCVAPDGSENMYSTIIPGQFVDQPTNPGVTWVVRDEKNEVRLMTQAQQYPAICQIQFVTPKSTGQKIVEDVKEGALEAKKDLEKLGQKIQGFFK